MEGENHVSDESVSSMPCMDFRFNFNTIQNNHQTTSANSSNNLGKTDPNQSQLNSTPGPSSNPVGLELGLGATPLHNSQQHIIHHQIYPNNSPQRRDLALSLNMDLANPHGINITTTHPPLIFYQNRNAAARPLLAQAHHHNPMPFRLPFPATHVTYDQRHYSQPIPSYERSSNHEHQTFKSSYEQILGQPTTPRFNHIIKKRARESSPKHCIIREPLRRSRLVKGGIENGRMKDQSTHILPRIAQKKNPFDGRATNSVYNIMFEEVGVPIDPHLRLFVPL